MCASPRPNAKVGDVTSPDASVRVGAAAVASEFDAATALMYRQRRSSNHAYRLRERSFLLNRAVRLDMIAA